MSETQPPQQLEQHKQHEQQRSLLTTSQEHYLKKYLLTVLINNELARLQKEPYETLPNLGGPFDLKDEHANSTTPFLRYLFESIVVPFPFLTSSRGALWPKLQLFMDEYAKIEAGNGVEREEMLRRKRLQNKGEKTLVLMYSMAIKTLEQRAQEKKDLVARKERLLQQQQEPHVSEKEGLYQRERHERHNSLDLLHQPLDQLSLEQQCPTPSPSRSRSVSPASFTSTIHGVRVNVVGVRTIKEKRHVREHEHAEFIIASAFADGQEYVVARRHGRFRRLFHTLRQAFPNLEIPVPPAKYPVKSGSSSGVKTAREKDRISLRGYLHNIAKVGQEVVDSPAFISFLSKDAIHLSEEEAKDVQMRVSLDDHRMAQQAKFDREVAKKVDELDSQLKEVKLDLLQPGGVSRLFSAFKHVDNVYDLPPLYQSVFEWGCMSFASTLYHVLTSSDDATLNFTQLKRTHFLLPYRTMWGILKVSNPMAMMKGIIDLFLAQPFGSRSLMQRILSVNMQEEVSEYKKEIAEVEADIGDPALCEKIRNYVFAPRAVVNKIFSEDEPYDITELSLVMDVLRSEEILPVLQPMQIKRVWDAQQILEQEKVEKERLKALNKQNRSDSDVSDWSSDSNSSRSSLDSSADEKYSQADAQHHHHGDRHNNHQHHQDQRQQEQQYSESNLIRQLQQLLVANLRIREKERLMELVFQGVTGEILKEVISIFYQPLVKVYKSANVADSLMDVKYFVDELIKVVEQAESDNGQGGASGKPSAATLYLNLVRKHLPSFYKFVHAVHKQDDGIFHDLLEWIESIITFMRTGFGHPRVDYKTGEELRVGIDLDGFVKGTVDPAQWEVIQKEAEELRVYFAEVKEQKREEVRQMAGLDRASHGQSNDTSGGSDTADQERIVKELRGMGMQQEDVDELEMINWENFKDNDGDSTRSEGSEDRGEFGLKVPKVPTIDMLQGPFVQLMNDVLFRTARE